MTNTLLSGELKVKFLVDESGRKTAAQMDIKTYNRLIRLLEDIEDTQLIEDAKKRGPKFRPYEEVRAEMKAAGLL